MSTDKGSAPRNMTLDRAIGGIARLLADIPDEAALEGLSGDYGRYTGLPPRIELLADGRWARLLEPIAYHRGDGSDWPVSAGAEIDGASIPRPFWAIIGGPFEGKYRDASIVHDHYCVTKSRSWRDTHRMFHDAMRCSGVGAAKAKVMFYAVYRFGPRWADPDEAVLEGMAQPGMRAPVDADAMALLCDAEAIVQHDLNVDEIAALADARRADASPNILEGIEDRSDADAIVVAGGRGDAGDIAIVAAHARALPAYVVDHFVDKGIRIIACCDSVTDFERDLANKVPRGWERTGRTWDSVPGAYFPDRKRVVIATVANGAGARVVPDKHSGMHGSDDLVVHEAMHGYDYSLRHAPTREPGFIAARKADLNGLTDYERQAGDAGREETFAETGAQHHVAADALSQRCPRLADYWQTMPVGGQAALEALEAVADGPTPVGLATRAPDGRIILDLRATDATGAIGHGWIEMAPGDAGYAELYNDLFSDAVLESPLENGGKRSAPFFG